MPTVTAYLGLCGSGKSYLARQVPNAVVIDENLPDRWPELLVALRSGKDCVVTEIGFLQEKARQEFERFLNTATPGTTIVWRPIERDLDKANRNCRRPERMLEKPAYDAEAHVELNSRLYPLYEYPAGVPVLKMWPYDEPEAGPAAPVNEPPRREGTQSKIDTASAGPADEGSSATEGAR